MKRWLCVALATFLLLLTFASCATRGNTAVPFGAGTFSASDSESAVSAIGFTVQSSFDSLAVHCQSQSSAASVTISVYAADTDYAITLSHRPLRTVTVSEPDGEVFWQFKKLKAGDYLIVLSDLKDVKILRTTLPSEETNGKTVSYENGSETFKGFWLDRILIYGSATDAIAVFAYPVTED